MSDTESFEQAMDFANTVVAYCDIPLLDRLQAAHDREIRDTAQQEYDRGFHDGQHSMDAEHRVIAMRLRGLRLDGDTHENLRRIAYAIYPCATGWTCESADGLRDKLIDLMGGVSGPTIILSGPTADQNDGNAEKTSIAEADDDAEPMTTDEFIEYVEEDTRRLKGDATKAGDGNDTCDSQCCGACADYDGDDSGEHAEVSDGRTGAIGVTEPIGRNDERGDDSDGRDSVEQVEVTDDGADGDTLGPDARGHAVGRDFHELGVSDGRVAHDCTADFRGRTGRDVVHMDGLVAYDVLDNERRKAIAELRKLPEWYKDDGKRSPAGKFNEAIGDAIGVEGLLSFTKIRDRLIHLLGGDKPSGIDVLREMDAESDTDGTSPNDVPTSSITDELREWARRCTVRDFVLTTYPEQHAVRGILEQLIAIADRIDEQFDRICEQQEAVLQSTIGGMVKEYEHDRLPDQLRIENLEKQRDNLLDLLRDARDEYKSLDQRSSETSANFHAMRDRVWGLEAERDELQEKLDGYEQTHMKLPRDKDGTYINVADTVRINDRKYGVYAVSNRYVWLNPFDDDLYRLYGYPADECKVVRKRGAING